MKYINKFMQGWWNAFDSFYSQLHETNSQLADDTGLVVLKEAGIDKDEIKSALTKLSFFPDTERFLANNTERFD